MTCKARRQGNEMYCPLCIKTWDIDDPNPPPCPEKMRHTEKGAAGTYKQDKKAARAAMTTTEGE